MPKGGIDIETPLHSDSNSIGIFKKNQYIKKFEKIKEILQGEVNLLWLR